jgi:hypothetical protein
MQGIFVGAKVQRGPDWDWGNQDGGKGKIGRVVDIRGWDGESGRSVANVIWASGITNVYRVGHKGKVDLTVATPGKNGYYYPEHLPVLGKKEPEEEEGATASRTVLRATAAVPTTPPLTNTPPAVAGNALSSPATPRFTVGEKVHTVIWVSVSVIGYSDGPGQSNRVESDSYLVIASSMFTQFDSYVNRIECLLLCLIRFESSCSDIWRKNSLSCDGRNEKIHDLNHERDWQIFMTT